MQKSGQNMVVPQGRVEVVQVLRCGLILVCLEGNSDKFDDDLEREKSVITPWF